MSGAYTFSLQGERYTARVRMASVWHTWLQSQEVKFERRYAAALGLPAYAGPELSEPMVTIMHYQLVPPRANTNKENVAIDAEEEDCAAVVREVGDEVLVMLRIRTKPNRRHWPGRGGSSATEDGDQSEAPPTLVTGWMLEEEDAATISTGEGEQKRMVVHSPFAGITGWKVTDVADESSIAARGQHGKEEKDRKAAQEAVASHQTCIALGGMSSVSPAASTTLSPAVVLDSNEMPPASEFTALRQAQSCIALAAGEWCWGLEGASTWKIRMGMSGLLELSYGSRSGDGDGSGTAPLWSALFALHLGADGAVDFTDSDGRKNVLHAVSP